MNLLPPTHANGAPNIAFAKHKTYYDSNKPTDEDVANVEVRRRIEDHQHSRSNVDPIDALMNGVEYV